MISVKKAFTDKLMETGIVVGFMSGLTAAVLICAVYHSFGRQAVATVNITGLINEFVQHESGEHFSPEKVKADVRNFGRSLEKDINRFSKNHHIIIFPKEAVVAGAADYTGLFRKKMSAHSHAGNK